MSWKVRIAYLRGLEEGYKAAGQDTPNTVIHERLAYKTFADQLKEILHLEPVNPDCLTYDRDILDAINELLTEAGVLQ